MSKYKHKYKQRLREMSDIIKLEVADSRAALVGESEDSSEWNYHQGRIEVLEFLYETLALKENEPDNQAQARRRREHAERKHAKGTGPKWCVECLWTGPTNKTIFQAKSKPLKCPSCDREGTIRPGSVPCKE